MQHIVSSLPHPCSFVQVTKNVGVAFQHINRKNIEGRKRIWFMRFYNNGTPWFIVKLLGSAIAIIYRGLEVPAAHKESRDTKLWNARRKRKSSTFRTWNSILISSSMVHPTWGFGVGVSRIIMSMLNFKDVHEATLLYRDPKRLIT